MEQRKQTGKVYPLQLELDEYDHPEELILSTDGNYLRIALPSASGDGPTQYSVYRLSDGKFVGSGRFLSDFPANSNRVIVADQRQHRLAVWDYDGANHCTPPPPSESRPVWNRRDCGKRAQRQRTLSRQRFALMA